MAVIDELLVELGFEYDPKDLDNFKRDLDKTVRSLAALAKAAIAGAASVTALTVASTAASDEQGKLAKEIGDTVENIDALQFALKRAGGTSEGMSNSLRQLAIRASEAARGTGSGVEAFGILGISVTDVNGNLKSTSDLMLEVSQRMQGLSKAQQIELADKLGIRDSVLLLQEGPGAIRDLIAEAKALGVTTAEDAAIAEDFQDSLADLWQIVKDLTRIITRSFAPILDSLVESFTEWWKLNREIIEQEFPKWLERLIRLFKILTIAMGAFLAVQVLTSLASLVTLLRSASLAAVALNAAMAALPFIIAAVAIAFIALVEDAKVFFEGGESFIGDMIKKFPEWEDRIRSVAKVLATIADITGMIFDGWAGIIDIIENFSLEGFKEFLGNLPGFLLDVTGIRSPGDNLDITAPVPVTSNRSQTNVDKVEIIVQGGADSADNIATAVANTFQQTSQDLNSVVDQ